MALRLAIGLGRSLGEIEQLSPAERAEWEAFYELEPWGYEIENFRSAMGPMVAAQIHQAGAKHPKRYRLSEFMRRPPVIVPQPMPADSVLAALGLKYPGRRGSDTE